MHSPVPAHSHDALHLRHGYRRFFAWTAAATLAIVFALVAAEVFFPESLATYPPPDAAGGGLDPDLYDFQLLLLVVAIVSCLASIAGLVIVAFLDSLELRTLRRRRAFDARLRRPEGGTPPPRPAPRNERLRALRDVAHSLEKS